MDRIKGAGHVNNEFVAEDPATLRPPTEITDDWLNTIQEELATFVEWAGLVLNAGDRTQVRQALLLKFATLANPNLTGTPTAPTAAPGTNTTQLANTAFVQAAIMALIATALGNDSNFAATMSNALAGKSPLAYPAFTGLVRGAIGGSLASSGLLNLSAASGNTVHITGTTPTSAVTIPAGAWVECIADAAWPLTYHATNNKLNTGGTSYTCSPGDSVFYFSDGATVYGWITKADGTAVNASMAALQGAARTLVGSSSGTSALVTYTSDEIITGDGAGNYQSTRGWNDTINVTSLGPGGLDAGAVAANTFYYSYAITKPDGTKKYIASTSATGPSFVNAPGYTKWARVGSFKTDATVNKYPLPFTQNGNRITFAPGAAKNLPSFVQATSGAVGTYGTAMAAVSTASSVPPTARKVSVIVQQTASTNGGIAVSSNAVYGAASGVSPGYVNMVAYMGVLLVEIPFETQGTIYVAAQGSTATFITGYEENF